MTIRRCLGTLIATALSLPAIAAEEPPKAWSGEAELGVVVTTGNTETENVTGRFNTTHEHDKWRETIRVDALKNSENQVTTAERYFLSGKVDYKFSALSYAFANVTYDDDRFSGYAYRASASVGLGRRVVDRDKLKLDLEAGLGTRRSELEATGDTQDEGLVRGAGLLKWQITDHSSFSEDLTVEAGEDATITKSITGLTTQIAGSLATKLTVTVKNTSDVPVGIEKTDTETAVTLVYSF